MLRINVLSGIFFPVKIIKTFWGETIDKVRQCSLFHKERCPPLLVSKWDMFHISKIIRLARVRSKNSNISEESVRQSHISLTCFVINETHFSLDTYFYFRSVCSICMARYIVIINVLEHWYVLKQYWFIGYTFTSWTIERLIYTYKITIYYAHRI